jgi:hypothetical protein
MEDQLDERPRDDKNESQDEAGELRTKSKMRTKSQDRWRGCRQNSLGEQSTANHSRGSRFNSLH